MCYNKRVRTKKTESKIFLKKNEKIFKKGLTNDLGYDIIYKSSARRTKNGSIAQLGEHLPYKQRVIGSSPIVSTMWSGSSVG